MESMNIRSAEFKDCLIIVDLMEQFYEIDHYPFDSKKHFKNLITLINQPILGKVWVITDDQEIIGYAVLCFGFSFEHGGKDAFVDEIFILPEHRQHGLGKILLEFVINEAKKLDVKAIHLEVEKHNNVALNLYHEEGFSSGKRLLLNKIL